MGKMPEAAIAALKKARGRPRTIEKHHGFGTENQRKDWYGRLLGVKNTRGSKMLKLYYSGNILSRGQAIEAMCCECLRSRP